MPPIDHQQLNARVGEMLNRHPAVGLAVGVVRNGSLDFFSGHGLADIASRAPVTEDTVFRVGSITKTFTAVAVMQLVEQGLVDLDAPANDYLRAYRLVPADPAGGRRRCGICSPTPPGSARCCTLAALVRPLFGETVPAGRAVPSLAEYYGPGCGRGRAGHAVQVHRPRVRHARASSSRT